MAKYKEISLLTGVTATTTSSPMSVEGFSAVVFQILRENHSVGSSAFTFDGTVDGTNWVALNTLADNVTNTNAQNITRVAGKTLSANGSALLWLDLRNFPLKAVRVKVTETTDGTHSCTAIARE